MTTLTEDHVALLREQFPALRREIKGQPVVHFDGPAGTQVPQRVIAAMSDYLSHHNANHGGLFATSHESDALLHEAHRAMADMLGISDPDCVSFGPNMTTLTFALSRALSKTWQAGDEIMVTRLDHDANVSPWVMAASDVGATVRFVNIRRDDATLDLDDLQRRLNSRTKLVAVACASNATGSVQPLRQIADWAHDVGALVFADAVHFAPHRRIDVGQLGCDFLICSAYKFFGPHVGVQWGRRELLEDLTAYKVRPCSEKLPEKWMTGTQNHEGIVGVTAAVDYLADIGRELADDRSLQRPAALDTAFAGIDGYERRLVAHLLAGLQTCDGVKIWGITDPTHFDQRLPTVSITHDRWTAAQVAQTLGEQGFFVWHGNYYALNLTETLGLEPEGMVRIGLVHYNTQQEVDRLLAAVAQLH
jgi:cysteine desulfurase family protein (TIGR01976 family)